MTRFIIAAAATLIAAAPASAQISWRIETPFGELKGGADVIKAITNPLSVINITGIPTTGDFLEVVARNPDQLLNLVTHPQDAAYVAVASGMSAARNAVLVKGGNRIPPDIRAALAPWYPAELLESIRWSTEWNAIQNVPQLVQFLSMPNIRAMTFMNVVIFHNPREIDDVELWAHEIHHAQQYKEWGLVEFAKRWVNNSSLTGPVEGPAYEHASMIVNAIQSRGGPLKLPVPTSGTCYEGSASVAYCDLIAAFGPLPATFVVRGIAQASSNGTRSGRMRFVMLADAAVCNTAATNEYGIDNSTRLEGPGFECLVTVPQGTYRRVTLSAPNYRSDATFTRATATLVATPGLTQGVCAATSASTARCDLSVAADMPSATFTVFAEAETVGDGTRSGSMQLNLRVRGATCNARAGQNVDVDNGTRLRGEGYSCTIVVAGGTTTRVEIDAPNNRATAKYTKAFATFVPGTQR